MNIKKICVLGGSGFVGRSIVRLLAEAGYNVRVPTRNRERAKNLIVLPTVDVIKANIHNENELDKLIAGVDAVINLVGIRYETKLAQRAKKEGECASFDDLHVELARKVINACTYNRVPRLLHMSSLAARLDSKSTYARSKAAAENLISRLNRNTENHKNIQTTIFRPSVIFGPDDHFLLLFSRMLKYLPIIPLGNYRARFQPIFVEDVAHAFVKSLKNPNTFNQRYNLCGPKIYTLKEIIEFIGNLTGRRRHIINLNNPLSYLQAAIMEKLPGKLLTCSDYYSMQDNSVCLNPFPAVFGFEPTAMEATAPAYLKSQDIESKYQLFRRRLERNIK